MSQEATAWLSSAQILVMLSRHSDVVLECSPVVIFVLSSLLCAGTSFLSSSQQMYFSFVLFSLFLTCCHVSVELNDRGNPSLNNSQCVTPGPACALHSTGTLSQEKFLTFNIYYKPKLIFQVNPSFGKVVFNSDFSG